MQQKPLKILLGQLNSMGDCLYATTIARQIKRDFPQSHLTWAITSYCKPIILNNADVDAIWEIPATSKKEERYFWNTFEKDAKSKLRNGKFDKIFLTQIFPNNIQNYDGTVRASILRGYPSPITVSLQPVINLTDEEINNVRNFSELHKLKEKTNVILFECSSNSGQSFITPEYAQQVSKKIISVSPNTLIILSSNKKIESEHPNIIDGSIISFRENAELTKYCTLFVGCSSGISWICTSTAAKKLPMIQVLKASTSVYASMSEDAEYFNLPKDNILEMFDCRMNELIDCIKISLENFKKARQKYNQKLTISLKHYFIFVLSVMLKGFFKGDFIKGLRSFSTAYKRYGIKPFLRLLVWK